MSSTFILDLSTAQVGTAVTDSFVNLTGGYSQFSMQNGRPPLLILQNESGLGLTVVIQGWGLTFQLPAGGWTNPIPLPVTATGVSVTPLYSLPGGNVAKLLGTVYGPDEPVVPVTTLGNSPLGGSISVAGTPANSFEQDEYTPWVLTGLVATKDGSISNQLDVTAGIAFLRQSDSSVGRVATSAATFLTSTPSTTYFLDLNPDGSFSFGTSHSVVSNHLTICSLTTDGSGNILVVTDARTLNTTLLAAMLGSLAVPPLLVARGGRGVMGTLVAGDVLDVDSLGSTYIKAATGRSITFQIPNGTTIAVMGSNGGFSELAGIMTAGNLGVPVIVAQTLRQSVAVTTLQTILTFSIPTNGLYRLSGSFYYGNASQENVKFQWSWTDSHGTPGAVAQFYLPGGGILGGGTPVGGGSGELQCSPATFQANVGTLTVQYQDPAGTPADTVSVILERLA